MYPFENMRQVNLVLKIKYLITKSLFLNRLLVIINIYSFLLFYKTNGSSYGIRAKIYL
jgi:hypothetical protein